jgi:hypothetical protein
VTHEVTAEWIDDVMREGEVRGTYGIFFTLGHIKSPQFVTEGYMIHGYIPHRDIDSNTIYPDMRFTPQDDEHESAWEVMWSEGRGNLYGLEIATSYERWAMPLWQAVVDTRADEVVWGAPSAVPY